MKKLWIVLLSVALIAAFAMPVCAADVKFSGSYVAQGYYEKERAIVKAGADAASVSNIWQRLRLQTDFKVQEGLSFTTRADILEKIWGAARFGSAQTPADGYNGTDADSQNIKFTHAYVSANLWGGLLRVGYQTQAKFGTDFLDAGEQYYGPRVRYDYPYGPWTFIVLWDKVEGSEYYSPAGPAGNVNVASYQTDAQADKFVGAFTYDWGKGNAGLLVYYYLISNGSGPATNPNTADTGYKSKYWIFDPYVKAQIGRAYIEAEVGFITGKYREFENAVGGGPDIDRSGWSLYGSLTYDLAPAYVGGTVIYITGDDPGSTDKVEAGASGGSDFNPCLLLFNYDLSRWEGKLGSGAAGISGITTANSGITNAFLLQVFAGIKPVPKLDLRASFTYAQADQDGSSVGWQSKDYGKELDITATYKIYDNLSYMVGFAYLWAGDWFKGTNSAAEIDNDYLITHKLTLSF